MVDLRLCCAPIHVRSRRECAWLRCYRALHLSAYLPGLSHAVLQQQAGSCSHAWLLSACVCVCACIGCAHVQYFAVCAPGF